MAASGTPDFKVTSAVNDKVARWRIEPPEGGAFEFELDLDALDIDAAALMENTRRNLPTRIACKNWRSGSRTFWDIRVAHVGGLVRTFVGTSITLVEIPSDGRLLSEWRTSSAAVGQALTAGICRLSGAAEN